MLQEDVDYYINEDGNFVFTATYHLRRGYCCKNKCRHCPWGYGKTKPDGNSTEPDDSNEINQR